MFYIKRKITIMRVGIDAHMLGDHSGGNESYYYNILLNMVIPEGDLYYIFVKKGTDKLLLDSRFIIVEFKEQNAFKRNFLELPQLCKKYKLDVLHTQYFIPFIRFCPVVCTIHDICFEHYKDIFTTKEYIRQKLLIPYAAKHARYIFTVSNHAKRDIHEHYNIPLDRIIVTYNAVGDEFRRLSQDELKSDCLRKKYNIKNDFILSVGNLQPRKNLVRLIRVFKRLKQCDIYTGQLVIVGKKAWMYNDILKEALDDVNDVIFTDYVSKEDLIRLYNDAEIFVYPSFFEGFGIPPLEALACGTAVAVANTTSLPEVVGDAGVYFNPFDEDNMFDSISKLINDADIKKNILARAEYEVEKFSWKISAEKIIDCYGKFK